MEIEDSRFQELVAAEAKLKQVEPELVTEKQAHSETKETLRTTEAEKVKAEGERDSEKEGREKAENTANEVKLRDERMAKLGTGFVAKLDKMPSTKEHLLAQAASASDDDWDGVLARTEESSGVKRDAKLDAKSETTTETEETAADKDLLFDREVVASAGVAPTTSSDEELAEPSQEARQSVVGGLLRPKAKA